MWFLVLLVCIARIERVVLQDGNRVILSSSNSLNPCEGHVKVYHNNMWGYVGDEYWSKTTEQVVCRSTHCGQPVGCSTDVQIPPKSKIWLNEMTCNGDERHLWDCSPPGWGISVYRKQTVKKIKCSNRINITLDGFRCAGAVQYSRNDEIGYFCAENWRKEEADRLCESLKCGKSRKILPEDWMVWVKFQTAKKMAIQCSGIEKDINHLWQCVSQESPTCKKPAFVECEDHEKLQLRGNSSNVCSGRLEKEENGKWERRNIKTRSDLWCQQMHCGTKSEHNQTDNGTEVTCSDKVKVQVGVDSKSTNCYGTVSVSLNGSGYSVCGTKWNSQAGEVVCRELNCGKVIVAEGQPGITRGIMDNVKCSGHESSLWHCQAKHDMSLMCPSLASVVCAGSLDVRLTDGPGRCAGTVEIWYKGEWMKVSKKGWTTKNSDSICWQLQCGKHRHTERFSQRSRSFFPKKVECKTSESNISDCITQQDRDRDEEAVGLTCEDHMVVFLKGSTSCSGLVGVERGNETYWLSGSNATWNEAAANLVCQQRHCGSLQGFGFVSNAGKIRDVWNKSLTCSSEHKSLLECDTNEPAPDHDETVANVTCSGGITVTLSNGCWGSVNVSMNGQSGGVCADAWTPDRSLMLCKELGCGSALTPSHFAKTTGEKVLLKSFHATKETTQLSECNVVKNNGSACESAHVVCSGSLRSRLVDSRDSCSGNVEVFLEGRWLPVCENALVLSKTQQIICQELQCGEPVKRIAYFGSAPQTGRSIKHLECDASGTGLKACNVTVENKGCTSAGLQCSNWSKKTLSDACHGHMIVHTSSGDRPVSAPESAGDRFCSDLDCGRMKELTNSTEQTCPVSETQQTQPLHVRCQNEPKVTLSGACSGDVRIDGVKVCDTNWNDDYSHMVCHEQRCSNAVPGLKSALAPYANDELSYHVMCEDFHHKLGQCKRYKEKCSGKPVSVFCVKSVHFSTTEICGGHIKVNYQGKWEKVCPLTQTPELQNVMTKLCKNIGCSAYNASLKSTKTLGKETLGVKLEYTGEHMDIRHSVRAEPCGEAFPAEIYCNGYESPKSTPPIKPVPIVPIMLGIGVFLILAILLFLFGRIWLIKKRRNTMKPFLGTRLSQTEMEIESGEFDQIKESEAESLTGKQAEMVMENSRQRTPSLPYDDIDDVAQALTAAGSSGHEEPDGVSYEVEDPQESYDDIDATPVVAQTTAEVHGGSQPAPEGPAAAPQEPQQDDDYLVPGRDG